MVGRHPVASFWVLACGISWLLWAPLWLPRLGVAGLPLVPFHHVLGALGPITAAILVAAAQSGRVGPADLLRRAVLGRGRWFWVGVALCLPFALLGVAIVVAFVAGEEVDLTGIGVSSEFPRLGVVGFFVYQLLTFGYGEETGWRGFALPRLQSRYSALVATLIITVGWALWHVPMFLYRPGYSSMGAGAIVGWFLSLLTGSVLLTWLYNESRGSILVVALFHAAVDVVFTSDIASGIVVSTTGALITITGILVLIGAGPRHLARRGSVLPQIGPTAAS